MGRCHRSSLAAIVAVVAVGCSGGGGAGPTVDAPLDTPFDAPLMDATLDAVTPDAVGFDAPTDAPRSLCGDVPVPVPVTMSPQPMPPFAYMPSIDFFWNSLVTLTTSVPLESLHLEIVNPQTGSWDGSGELYLGCTGPLIASLTRESETYPSLPDRTWGEADLGPLAAGTYVVLLTAIPISNLDVTLTAHGVIPAGEACTDPLVAAGVLSCAPTSNCLAGICTLAACADGLDNDGDGVADAVDPGCAAVNDDDEDDDCLSTGVCPACANGLDDDGDGYVDAPGDHGCRTAGDPDERNCPDPNPVIEVGTGGLFDLTDAMPATRGCRQWVSSGPERMFHLRKVGVSNVIHFNGPLWTSFVVYQDTCDGPGVRCLAITPEGGEAVYDLSAGDYYIAAFGSGPVSIH